MQKVSILFVCLGNICRSPMAEAVFRHLVSEKGKRELFLIDSCGTGAWHVGSKPHEGTQKVLKKNNIDVGPQRARQLDSTDFAEFHYIVAMDSSNLSDIESHFGRHQERIFCLRKHDLESNDIDVPDPYYGGLDGFDHVYEIIHRSCVELLDNILDDLAQ